MSSDYYGSIAGEIADAGSTRPPSMPAGSNGEAYGYPRTNSGPLCRAEETGYLDSTDVLCPFASDGKCTGGCPGNRERACIMGEE